MATSAAPRCSAGERGADLFSFAAAPVALVSVSSQQRQRALVGPHPVVDLAQAHPDQAQRRPEPCVDHGVEGLSHAVRGTGRRRSPPRPVGGSRRRAGGGGGAAGLVDGALQVERRPTEVPPPAVDRGALAQHVGAGRPSGEQARGLGEVAQRAAEEPLPLLGRRGGPVPAALPLLAARTPAAVEADARGQRRPRLRAPLPRVRVPRCQPDRGREVVDGAADVAHQGARRAAGDARARRCDGERRRRRGRGERFRSPSARRRRPSGERQRQLRHGALDQSIQNSQGRAELVGVDGPDGGRGQVGDPLSQCGARQEPRRREELARSGR